MKQPAEGGSYVYDPEKGSLTKTKPTKANPAKADEAENPSLTAQPVAAARRGK